MELQKCRKIRVSLSLELQRRRKKMSQNNWDDTFRAYVIEKIQYCRCRYSVIPIRLTTHFDISFYYFDPWPTWFDSTGWSFDCCRNQRLPPRWWRRRRRPCTRKTRRTPWTLFSTWTEWMFPSSDAGSSRPDLIPASGLLRSFPVPGVSEISDLQQYLILKLWVRFWLRDKECEIEIEFGSVCKYFLLSIQWHSGQPNVREPFLASFSLFSNFKYNANYWKCWKIYGLPGMQTGVSLV